MGGARTDRVRIVAIIPARYASIRFPGKPIADLLGKPLIQWVYENAQKSPLLDDVIVATDSPLIYKVVNSFGGKVVITAESHKTGTDRIAEVAQQLSADIIVNIQGDEPLMRPEMIEEATSPFIKGQGARGKRQEIEVTTLKKRITDLQELENPNVVKVVTDKKRFALYFSRASIPYVREKGHGSWVMGQEKNVHYKHIGLYVYRKDFLLRFARMDPTPLEEVEKLEQLRMLENGTRPLVVETEYDSIGVDTPEDLEKVKKILSKEKEL